MLGLNPKTSSFGINNQITSHSHSIHIHSYSIHNQSQLVTRQSKYMPRIRPNKSQMHQHKNMKNKHGTSLLIPTGINVVKGQPTGQVLLQVDCCRNLVLGIILRQGQGPPDWSHHGAVHIFHFGLFESSFCVWACEHLYTNTGRLW